MRHLTRALSLSLSFLVWLPQSNSSAAPWSPENAKYNVNVNPDMQDPAKFYGEWPDHRYNPSPEDWRALGVYQLITDRFSDGDPLNNEGRYGGYDPFDVGKRHGGDFRGLAERLDYIKGLGYDAIWISPIFQNQSNSYHGYGQIDFTLLDERFGTLDEFRKLVQAAHQRQMYVIVDVVVNHLANLYFAEGYQNAPAPFHLHAGEYRLHPRDPAQTYSDFRVDNTFDPNGKYCALYGWDGQRHEDPGSGTFSLSDLHHNGTLSNYRDPWNAELGKIYDLYDDLRTTHPRVQDKIIAMTKALIASTDIDGIRIDTPMQVPRCFFDRWTPAVRQFARSLGKKNFFIFAETYCVRQWAASLIGRGKTPNDYGKEAFIGSAYAADAGIHYSFYKQFMQPVLHEDKDGYLDQARVTLEKDFRTYDLFNADLGRTQYRMLNFFNNHDQRRLTTAVNGSKKTDLAAAIISLWPGVPLFYYGDEQAFSSFGTALEGHAREDMMASVAWKNHPAAVDPNPATADNFDMTNPHYLWVQKLMNLRKKYPALSQSDRVVERWVEPGKKLGLYVFSREDPTTGTPVLIAFNAAAQKKERRRRAGRVQSRRGSRGSDRRRGSAACGRGWKTGKN